jgi:adenylate cyclase
VETQSKLRARLDEVRKTVGGKAVLVGWAATGSVDFYPTSVHARCPGSVIHGAVFNAIMTRQFWRRPPGWVTPLTTFVVGLVATMLVAGLSPLRAMVAVLFLIVLFGGINDALLFDYGNLLLNAAGPLAAAGLVWSGVTLAGFMNEVAERGRITKRFRAYVDPTLVNYVLDNPERATFAGQEREMTVVFTDLQGFTSLSEVLRSGIVKLIAEYMELMVPVIRSHNGFVNKFLGDGIMFFFGAPQENPNHAADALEAVLDMQQLLERFNERLRDQELPTLSMRAGVSTGTMFVGDAGPSFASEFTVLGDRVNLASRLESANKVTGTRNLVTARTLQRAGDRFLARPVAKLRVVGRKEPAVVYEVLCRNSEGGERERRLIELSKRVFDAYQSDDLAACRVAVEDISRAPGLPAIDKFVRLYLDACAQPRDPHESWDGHITLGAK